MKLVKKCKKTKSERKDVINSKDRNLRYNDMEGTSGCCSMWEDLNVALHNDTNFEAKFTILFALNNRLLGMKNEIS